MHFVGDGTDHAWGGKKSNVQFFMFPSRPNFEFLLRFNFILTFWKSDSSPNYFQCKGHYFAMGGSMRGGRILGEYPSDLTSKGPYNIGRGRMIPTTSWDAVWHGVAEWFGIKDDAGLDKVLPNRGKFSRIYNEIDLFG